MKRGKEKQSRRSLTVLTVIAVLLLLSGLAVLLYPTVSNTVGTAIAEDTVQKFDAAVSEVIDMPKEEAVEEGIVDEEGYPINEEGERTSEVQAIFKLDLDRLYEDSVSYNHSLLEGQGPVDASTFETSVLNLVEYGLPYNSYGYISASAIGMKLPIFLGASESNMSYGAAHLANTSLPIDETNTNVAIAAHTGYIGRIFFDNIKKLEIGDVVTITNFWGDIDYEVIETKVVSAEGGDVSIKQGRQLLTLITCISDGNGGFDRYIVICEK